MNRSGACGSDGQSDDAYSALLRSAERLGLQSLSALNQHQPQTALPPLQIHEQRVNRSTIHNADDSGCDEDDELDVGKSSFANNSQLFVETTPSSSNGIDQGPDLTVTGVAIRASPQTVSDNDGDDNNGDMAKCEEHEIEIPMVVAPEQTNLTPTASAPINEITNVHVIDQDIELLDESLGKVYGNFRAVIRDQVVELKARIVAAHESKFNSSMQLVNRQLDEVVEKSDIVKEQLAVANRQISQLDGELKRCNGSLLRATTLIGRRARLRESFDHWKRNTNSDRLYDAIEKKLIAPSYKKMYMKRIMHAWHESTIEMRIQARDSFWKEQLKSVSEQLIARYEIELSQLRMQIEAAVESENKHRSHNEQMKRDLKLAFMRGVSQLNLEAMYMFDGDPPDTSPRRQGEHNEV